MKTIEEINEDIMERRNNGQSVKTTSDGYHTFGDYTEMRNVYFVALCNVYSDIAWKSLKHYDEENDPIANFNGCFICGIDTPEGTVAQHLKMKFWEELDVPIRDNAPKYDGYTDEEIKRRIRSLRNKKVNKE